MSNNSDPFDSIGADFLVHFDDSNDTDPTLDYSSSQSTQSSQSQRSQTQSSQKKSTTSKSPKSPHQQPFEQNSLDHDDPFGDAALEFDLPDTKKSSTSSSSSHSTSSSSHSHKSNSTSSKSSQQQQQQQQQHHHHQQQHYDESTHHNPHDQDFSDSTFHNLPSHSSTPPKKKSNNKSRNSPAFLSPESENDNFADFDPALDDEGDNFPFSTPEHHDTSQKSTSSRNSHNHTSSSSLPQQTQSSKKTSQSHHHHSPSDPDYDLDSTANISHQQHHNHQQPSSKSSTKHHPNSSSSSSHSHTHTASNPEIDEHDHDDNNDHDEDGEFEGQDQGEEENIPANTLVQACLEDICDRQLLYIRGQRAIVTCIDFPLIFWRYIDVEVEKEYVSNFIASDSLINVNSDCETLSPHFYQVTLSAYDMGRLVSTSEFHRSFSASPSIFQISYDLQQQLRNMVHPTWQWPDYANNQYHESDSQNHLLDTLDQEDWETNFAD